MSLIKSISGIRGTIGGEPGQGLTPIDIVRFTAAYAKLMLVRKCKKDQKPKCLLGRDARISGPMVHEIVCQTLLMSGVDVVDVGLTTTPTLEMAVIAENADGGIMVTASHNPIQWNALKFFNDKGEFIDGHQGQKLLMIAEKDDYIFADVHKLGSRSHKDYLQHHIDQILSLPLVDVRAIKEAQFRIALDAVNSTGGMAIIPLLQALGVAEIFPIYCEASGRFPHNPEPLPENLNELSNTVTKNNAHLGFAVDPDVDRLAIMMENGECFGEEYTLVAVADYVLKYQPGDTVSNLSSTKALSDISDSAGVDYHASPVGEINVVTLMKEVKAVIGGEGNGGVIYPELHYGRDALVGIALFLSHLAKSKKSCSQLRKSYPDYFISKNKISLDPEMNIDRVLALMAEKYSKQPLDTSDGLKIFFDNQWVHLRKSNTEPIIRIYAESNTTITADHLATKIIADIGEILRNKSAF